jgi:hypothetical protein
MFGEAKVGYTVFFALPDFGKEIIGGGQMNFCWKVL